jgi:Cu-Zn family superoxide dismutase
MMIVAVNLKDKQRGRIMKRVLVSVIFILMSCGIANAGDLQVKMHLLNQEGLSDAIGTVTISETEYGLVFTPQLEQLSPQGLHGFHVHQNPSCLPAEKDGKTVPGLAAGGHYDPSETGMHDTQFGKGHLGDLPALYVDENGMAISPVLAPRLKKLEEVKGRSLMIHAGGDNYSDVPAKLGGGGARMACGLIE